MKRPAPKEEGGGAGGDGGPSMMTRSRGGGGAAAEGAPARRCDGQNHIALAIGLESFVGCGNRVAEVLWVWLRQGRRDGECAPEQRPAGDAAQGQVRH